MQLSGSSLQFSIAASPVAASVYASVLMHAMHLKSSAVAGFRVAVTLAIPSLYI